MKISTPYLYALNKNVGVLNNVDITEGDDYSNDDIVLFTGSLFDKSEIAKRDFLGQRATYITITHNNYSGDIDPYWQANTLVMSKSFAKKVLNREKIASFYAVIKQLQEWAGEAFKEHEKEKLEQTEQDSDKLNELTTLLAIQSIQYQYEKVKRRAFRGEEAKQINTKYLLKYNSKAKHHQSLILRVSEMNGEKSYAMIYVEGIKGSDELIRFYEEHKNDLEQFDTDMLRDQDLNFESKIIKLQRVYDIPETWHLILLLKDNSAKTIFENNDIPDIDSIEDFVMLKNSCDQKVIKNIEKISRYRTFLEHMRSLSEDEGFLIDFSKVVASSKNSFLIGYLHGKYEGDESEKRQGLKDSKYSREILNKVYSYLWLHGKKEDSKATNLQAIITILYDFGEPVDTMDERLVCNLYYHLRNSVLQNNLSFLREFDEYDVPKKLSSEKLEEIERCIKIHADDHPRFFEFKEYLEIDTKYRGYKRDYLVLLLSLTQNSQCEKYSFSIEEVLKGQNFDKALSLESYMMSEEETDPDENGVASPIFSISEEYLPPEKQYLSKVFRSDIAESMTYIDNYMLIPQLTMPESFKCLDEKRLLDLTVMFACSFYVTGAKTLTKVISLMQKAYVKEKEGKRNWLLSVANIALGTLHECSERDPYSRKIAYFEDEKFELSYENRLVNFVDLSPYIFDDDFITIEASRNTFKKYFREVKITAEDEKKPEKYQPEENKNLYKIEKLERLFHPKYGYFSLLEREIDKSEHQLDDCSALKGSTDTNVKIPENLKRIEQELFIESCLKRNKKKQYVEACEAVKMILMSNNR